MSIWRGLQSLDALNVGQSGGLIGHLGIKFTEIGADFIRATMPVDAHSRQPYGLLHGGASTAFAETVGTTAAAMCVDPRKFQCAGQEISANHVRAARGGLVTATARPMHLGGRSQIWGIDIVDQAGKLVCTSRLTVAVSRSGAADDSRSR